MNWYPSLWSIHWENNGPTIDKCSEFPHRMVSFNIQFMWFEVEWWCLDSAGYGATEFRMNGHWLKGYIKRLRSQYGRK